jgi:hypothetical protein
LLSDDRCHRVELGLARLLRPSQKSGDGVKVRL